MKIVILDTGCSNLSSIFFSIKRLGYIAKISIDKKELLNADKIFLPGVGTAKSAMEKLNYYKLINLIKKHNKPILGICLGMQLFASKSNENNNIKTLNIIENSIRLLNTNQLPLPHMGWNQVNFKKNKLFNFIDNKSYFYFSHSYIMPINYCTIAKCDYGETFSAAIQKNNFFGVQFHPEKSSCVGLQLLKNFLDI